MGKYVTMTAALQCNFGMAPGQLMIVDPMRPLSGNMMMANIMDNKPMANIMPFGMCQSMSNPQVSAATAAAMGVLTPMPCVPVIAAPWSPAGKVMVGGQPALMDNGKLTCNWGGQISINNPGGSQVEG